MAAAALAAVPDTIEPASPPDAFSTAPHVFVAIAQVMADLSIEGVAKSRRNSGQGYDFRGIDDMYNALAPILARRQLVISPRGLSRVCEERRTAKDAPIFYVNVAMEYTLTSAVDGSHMVVGPMYGEAMDSADKATNKAQSAAFKYMAMQQFCIPTEGDNDADASHYETTGARPPSGPSVAVQALKLSIDLCVDRGDLNAWAKRNDAALKDISDAEYSDVLAHFQARRAIVCPPSQTEGK